MGGITISGKSMQQAISCSFVYYQKQSMLPCQAFPKKTCDHICYIRGFKKQLYYQSTICSVSIQKNHIKYHFLNDLVEAQSTYCASKYMETDRLTKGLPIKQLEDWQELCNVRTY